MHKPDNLTLARFFLIGILVLLSQTSPLFAQRYLILQKGENQKTRIRYEVGESITYKLRDTPYFMTDLIQDIQPEHLLFGDNIIAPWQIETIDIFSKDERNSTLRNLTLLPAGAALLLITAESVNSLYADGTVEISRASSLIAGGLAGSALIMSQLRHKKFRIKGKRKLLIIAREEWASP